MSVSDLQERVQIAVGDEYVVVRELGRGGMAVVFLAERPDDRRRVAIKVLNPHLTLTLARERFQREMRITSSLKHPSIVPILECRAAGDLLYYVMAYLEGEDLRTRLERETRLPTETAVAIARQVGDALAYAHAAGVVHRDIKPDNIILVDDRAVVADFGVARAISHAGGETLTAPGVAMGTPYYMSPEQARGVRRLDGRSDIYSLGCLLYEMLTGSPPFDAPTPSAVMGRRVTEPPPHVRDVRPDVPHQLDRALHRAMATTPDRRYGSAVEFVEALASL